MPTSTHAPQPTPRPDEIAALRELRDVIEADDDLKVITDLIAGGRVTTQAGRLNKSAMAKALGISPVKLEVRLKGIATKLVDLGYSDCVPDIIGASRRKPQEPRELPAKPYPDPEVVEIA